MDVEYQGKVSDKPQKEESQSKKRENPGIFDILPADLKRVQGNIAPERILAITIGGIVLAEVVAMIFVYYYRFLPYYLQVLLDTSIMTVIIFPLLYFLSFRPLLVHIQKRSLAENVTQVRLRLMQFANTHTLDELLQVTLDEIEALTGSTIGFFHFLESDQKTLWLQAWSTNTLQNMCKAEGKGSHYDVEQAGVWADCVRQRQPVIHNDYVSLPGRKGLPAGHAPILREVAVPVMRDQQVKAILGLGNKLQDYTAGDVEIVSTLADFAWDIVEHKRAEMALQESEEKFRTLVDWTYDWEKWLDPQGDIVYMSPSCERITGYSPDEFIANPDLLIRIVHPDDRLFIDEHHRVVHNETIGAMNVEYRIIARDGSEHWIEHACRPLFGRDNRYLGRRESNRDITERKQAEQKISEQAQKEKILNETIHTMQIDIARDLHDTLGQNVSFLRMNLEHLADTKLSKYPDVQIEMQSMSKVANESYDLIRGMLAVLQIKDSADLLYLFSRYSEQVAERAVFKIDFVSHGTPILLSAHQMRHLFYIFREALSNVEKHAHADQVHVTITWHENSLTLEIADNGNGFDPASAQKINHYGLKFMQERINLLNGSLNIHTGIGGGTNILVNVPRE